MGKDLLVLWYYLNIMVSYIHVPTSHHTSMVHLCRGGGALKFLVGICCTGFQKKSLVSKFSLKSEGSWEILEIWKFCFLRAEILAKNEAENAKFLQNENGGHMSGD